LKAFYEKIDIMVIISVAGATVGDVINSGIKFRMSGELEGGWITMIIYSYILFLYLF
jgi:hypothetical protein